MIPRVLVSNCFPDRFGSSPSPFERRRGSLLVLGLVVVTIVVLTTSAMVMTALNRGKSSQHDLDYTSAFSLAESVADKAKRLARDRAAAAGAPAESGTVTVGGEEFPYTVVSAGSASVVTDADGVFHNVEPYLVSTAVGYGRAQARIEEVFEIRRTPLFQYMIFYDDDLELLPGPSMNLTGRVHANGDIYVGCGDTLTVDSEYFRASGSIYRRRKNDGSESGGTVQIKVAGSASYQELTNDYDAEYAAWTQFALDTWSGTVMDGSHGVTSAVVPDIASIKAFESDGTTPGAYHGEADLVIVDGVGYDGDGNTVDLSGVLVEKTMYDAREGKNITVTEIDMAALNASGHFPANGLLYAYRTGASAAQPDGIRLVNGAELAGPLTVVTEDPLYVQGDFNTVDKKGAAVIADAVNLLSNGWSDGGGTMQSAAATTYNLAMITGNVPTPDGGGNYSGGFENLPRFHEDWSGVAAVIRGSFINLFQSEIGTADWGTSGVYSPPIRDWSFDADLLSNLPPFTPSAVEVRVLEWDDDVPLPFVVQ